MPNISDLTNFIGKACVFTERLLPVHLSDVPVGNSNYYTVNYVFLCSTFDFLIVVRIVLSLAYPTFANANNTAIGVVLETLVDNKPKSVAFYSQTKRNVHF